MPPFSGALTGGVSDVGDFRVDGVFVVFLTLEDVFLLGGRGASLVSEMDGDGCAVVGVPLAVLDDLRAVLAPSFWGSLGLGGTLDLLVWEVDIELEETGAAGETGLGVGAEPLFFRTLSRVRT